MWLFIRKEVRLISLFFIFIYFYQQNKGKFKEVQFIKLSLKLYLLSIIVGNNIQHNVTYLNHVLFFNLAEILSLYYEMVKFIVQYIMKLKEALFGNLIIISLYLNKLPASLFNAR